MNQQQLRVLIAAALIDGELQQEEQTLLAEAALRAGVGGGELAGVITEVQAVADVKSLFQPLPRAERQAVFGEAVQMVVADRRMYPKETAFLRRLGLALGFEPAEIGQLILANGRTAG